ncbi:MAG TPA: UDP-3-O-acyl-N-acetylglucosamine deacetylase, partial [Oculatellaceae cyanobacterium]
MSSLAVSPVTVEGIGLMSGLSVRVEISPAPKGHGIVFYMEGESPIPACLEAVAHTERGVVLANPERKTLAIVEHFL